MTGDISVKKLDSSVISKILKAKKSFLSSIPTKDTTNFSIQKEAQLYPIQKVVLQKMLDHIGECKDSKDKDPNMLLNIATGFGKSFIQIAFAGILEHAESDYRIIVPDNLVRQLQVDVDKFFSDPLAGQIKSKIAGHKEFLQDKWKDRQKLSKSTFLMIDEVDSATHEELYRKRVQILLKEHPCVNLSATPQQWLHENIKSTKGEIISISLNEKIESMGIIPAHSKSLAASSIIKRTNKRSGFLPYACITMTAYLLVLSIKIYSNSYTIDRLKDFLVLYNLYNFYLTIFILNPAMGQILLFAVVVPFIINPINFVINKIADRDISGRLIANFDYPNVSSPAHDDVYESEETFVYHKTLNDIQPKDIQYHKIHSPKGKKSLILACNHDVIVNLNLIYRGEEDKIYKNGKLFSSSKIHDKHKLGKDFGEKYDFSYKESQRRWCIKKCTEEIKRNYPKLEKLKIDVANKVDFSGISAYSEYRVMHGVINSTLLALLQKCCNDDGSKKYEDVIALDKARTGSPEKLLQDIKNTLEDQDNIEQYLKEKGFAGDLLTKMTEQVKYVVEVLSKHKDSNEFLRTIVNNWELDKNLHNMMKMGDEYQILDDICDEFEKIVENNKEIKEVPNSIVKIPPWFDNAICGHLYMYFEDNFGLKLKCDTINQMYAALHSKDYPALALLFKENKLIEKINNNESKFPLYKLREVCKKNKIIFDNLKTDQPFYKLDEEKKPISYGYTSAEVEKLFTEGWIGTLVNPSKIRGFSDPTLHNVAMIVGAKDDEINNPDKIYQSYGRNRGLDPKQQPFFRIITAKGVDLCFDVENLLKKDCTQDLFKARKKYNKMLLKKIGAEISNEVILYIDNHVDPAGKVNDLSKFCQKLVVKKFEDLYNRNDYDLNKTKKEFVSVLKGVEKSFVDYRKNVKNQGKPSVLYAAPYNVAYILTKALYYLWIALDYAIFSLSTIGKSKGFSKEATYVHIIKEYYFEGSIERQKIIEKLLELSKDKFDKLSNSSICKKAFKDIISPLQDEHIITILNAIDPNKDDNKKKVTDIRSFLEGESSVNKETAENILKISKEIVAAYAWYHDSTDIVGNLPKLKTDDPVFSVRNAGNAASFAGSFFYEDNKFCFYNKSGKEYRKEYGSGKTLIIFTKWFLLLVIFPQTPYLLTTSTALASTASTVLICIPLMAFIFGCPEKFRSFVFNQQSIACNKLELIANEEKIPIIENVPDIIKKEFSSRLDDIKPLTGDNITNDNYLNSIRKVFSECFVSS